MMSPTIHKSPVEERVIHEGLQNGHYAVFVLSQYSHHTHACAAEISLNSRNLEERGGEGLKLLKVSYF